MPKLMTRTPVDLEVDHVDLDFRETTNWTLYSGIPSLSLLFGDEEVGPYVFLSASEPMEEQMPTGFAHLHPSDNWRISVRGTTNMGRDEYRHGEFRFHDGGKPYASDNLTWGPDGGFGLVLMGDRRGFAVTPVQAEVAERVEPTQVKAAEAMGVERLDPCPGAPAIVTSAGPTRRAHLDGGFGDVDGWVDVADGVRGYLGLLGEPERGPVVVLLDAEPGAVAWPARRLATDSLVVPIDGSVDADGSLLDQGSVRLERADADAPALVAGEAGAKVTVIVGDRRALLDVSGVDDEGFGSTLAARLRGLLDDLER